MQITNNPPAVNQLYNQAIGRDVSGPPGYVKNGLVVALDCKSGLSENAWVDMVSGKTATLYNVQITDNGLVLNGSTSYGTIDDFGATRDVATIEACYKMETYTNISGSFIWSPPGRSYIGLVVYPESETAKAFTTAIDIRGSNRYKCVPAQDIDYGDFVTFSAVSNDNNGPCFFNKVAATFYYSGSVASNYNGCTYTTIGARDYSADSRNRFFKGTLYAIRIYNRRLTAAEMLYNQTQDMKRFNQN